MKYLLMLLISLNANAFEWDSHLKSEIAKQNLPATIKLPCKKPTTVNECTYKLMVEMARYESGFKPEATYKENFKDSQGRFIISRGLYQLSVESANQKAYGCGVFY